MAISLLLFQLSHNLNAEESTRPLGSWKPRQAAAAVGFVGSSACSPCHERLLAAHRATGMARASRTAQNCQVLAAHPSLTFRDGEYNYEIVRQGGGSVYKVRYRDDALSMPISYCIGHGEASQTYLLEHRGAFYESRLSFYPALEKLDMTGGVARNEPESLETALGQKLTPEDAQKCFSCHATNAVGEDGKLRLDGLIQGIGCEACHGPAAEHVEAAKAGQAPKKGIFSPTSLTGDELSQQFCGSCHRSFEEALAMPDRGGIGNVRFQPYRLAKSSCYYNDPKDRKISCIGCHDPHESVARQPAFYDAKCLACHASGAKSRQEEIVKSCRRSSKDCSTCHMPKTSVPGAHAQFTDHFIRIVRPGLPYPQ
jgi:hypothetical protein